MEQYKKIVLEAPEGMHYTASQGEEGELIVRLVLDSSLISQKEEASGKDAYFTKITAEDREKVKVWAKSQKAETYWQKNFLEIVGKAVQNINYDYWIANLEPSMTESGDIFYAEGEDVAIGLSVLEWQTKAKEYAPSRGSRLATRQEIFLWYALRIVNGLWTFEYVTTNSSSEGNYKDAPNTSGRIDKTGAKVCGGYKDGQGNTFKIVIQGNKFSQVGGNYDSYGYSHFVSRIINGVRQDYLDYYTTGVLVLTK